jgi:hypothetical protein
MELINQFITAEGNKTATVVVELAEHHRGHGQTVQMDSYYSSA